MRILVLSDIHANSTALTAALGMAKDRWDHIACLGDVVGYGPDPNEVTTMIRELGARTIRGNHDKAATDLMETHDFNPVAKAAVDWTRSQLSPENLKWISELPSGPLETDGVVLVHGAFQDEDEYVFTPAQALEGLLDSTTAVTFFGHTHKQGGFRLAHRSTGTLATERTLELEPDYYYLVNPGSVGQPRDGDPRAAYAVYSPEERTVEFRRVAYDVDRAAAKIRAAGLPDFLAARLHEGL